MSDLHYRARKAFDAITHATYYGFAAREVLANDPEALEAAEKLAALFEQKLQFKRTPMKREGDT